MGFYGNIGNTTRTTFQFDRIVDNRAMISGNNAMYDGIYIGRYVLVKYDKEFSSKDYRFAYRRPGENIDVDGYLYTTTDCRDNEKIKYVPNGLIIESGSDVAYGVSMGTFVIVDEGLNTSNPDTWPDHKDHVGPYAFYICSGQDEDGWAVFKRIGGDETIEEGSIENYVFNYNADKDWAELNGVPIGRGWDSTVWQKVYANGLEKYVLVAELNSVVPTFEVSADAPTLTPLTPHFDERSTDVYYKLHIQPSWGLRVKSSDATLTGPVLDPDGNTVGVTTDDPLSPKKTTLLRTDDSTTYPSDDVTMWERYDYDRNESIQNHTIYSTKTNDWALAGEIGTKDSDIPAAIYWNNAGFNSKDICYSSDLVDSNEKTNQYHNRYNETIAQYWEDQDSIKITPTGQSGHSYELHGSNYAYGETDVKPDTQELSIMLPSIGNSIAHMWDIVYGDRETNDNIKHTNERNTDIAWEGHDNNTPERKGLRIVQEQYNEIPSTLEEAIGKYYVYNDALGDYVIVDTHFVPAETGQKYYTKGNGFTFNRKEVDTLAGCINTVHDLMGMIIVDEGNDLQPNVDTNADKFDDNKIYYFAQDGSYRYRKVDYKYTELDCKFEPADIDDLTYAPNVYYIKNSSNQYVPDEAGIYNSSTNYYKKVSNDDSNQTYKEIELFELPATSYYRDPDGSYILYDDMSAQTGLTYYTLENDIDKASKFNFNFNYRPNAYYYRNENNDFALDTKATATLERVYYDLPKVAFTPYTLELKDLEKFVGDQYQIGEEEWAPLKYLFSPGRFYYEDGEKNGRTVWKAENDFSLPHANEGYYLLDIAVDQDIDNEETLIPQKAYKVELEVLDDNKTLYYWVKDEQVYAILTQAGLNAIQADLGRRTEDGQVNLANEVDFCTLNELLVSRYEGLYSPGKYCRKLGSNFIIANEVNPTEGDTYYMVHELVNTETAEDFPTYISFSAIQNEVYIPNKYYYYDEYYGEHLLCKDKEYDPEKAYFTREDFYVMKDEAGIYPVGAVWNTTVSTIPCTVTLAKREPVYTLETLTGFARTLNTIHGLIIEINRLLALGDYKTRDRNTVQGAINVINDIINSFGYITPRQFTIIDGYGRVTSAPWTTEQALTYTNIGKPSANGSKAADENMWFGVDIDPNPVHPLIEFKHRFNPTPDTTTTANKNNDSGAVKDGLNKAHGDTIDLYTPIVDSMGHVIGKNTETVTLPYGFKTIRVANSSAVTDATSAINSTGQVADNTQDTLSFDSANKWIKFDNASEDTIKVGHLVAGFTSGNSNTQYGLRADKSISDLDSTNQFIVPTFKFDEAGHILMAEDHTINLPENFTKVAVTTSTADTADSTVGSAGTIEADTLTDTMTIAEGNKWVNVTTDAANDKVTLSHYVKGFTEQTATKNLNDATSTIAIQDIAWDRAGHITGSTKTTYTLPNDFQKIEIANHGSSETKTKGATDGVLAAKNTVDTAIIDTGNRWLSLVANTTNNSVTLYHMGAGTAINSKGDTTAQTPNFGSTFKVTNMGIDDTGHVTELNAHTVTIPQGSLTQETAKSSANVLTDISFTPATGATTVNRTNIGNLVLTGYLTGSASALSASDTLNSALGKLEGQLNKLNGSASTSGSVAYQIANGIADLESVAMPSHDDLTNNSVYMVKKTASGLEWVEVSTWMGGSY